jgi:hypothetical protein
VADAWALDDAAYPNLKRQWKRTGPPRWVPGKPDGRGQPEPFAAEYQAIFKTGLANVAAGGHGTDPTYVCLSPGMPRIIE